MKLLITAVTVSSLFLSSAANCQAPAPETVPTPESPVAQAGASDAASAAIGSPEAGKALVVFFRPSAFKGAALGFIVREADAELGKLKNGNFFTLQVEPG